MNTLTKYVSEHIGLAQLMPLIFLKQFCCFGSVCLMLTGFFVKKREPGFVVCAGDPMEKPQQIRGAESGC